MFGNNETNYLKQYKSIDYKDRIQTVYYALLCRGNKLQKLNVIRTYFN